ncbi:MAG: hypothetical protein AMXMBFR58_28690 [Phycisphaerae bacterium]
MATTTGTPAPDGREDRASRGPVFDTRVRLVVAGLILPVIVALLAVTERPIDSSYRLPRPWEKPLIPQVGRLPYVLPGWGVIEVETRIWNTERCRRVFGFPFPFLYCDRDISGFMGFPAARKPIAWEHAIRLHDGDAVPLAPTLIPTGVYWPYYLVNAALWSLFVYAASTAAGWLRRRHRSLRGRCVACAYDISASTICPECGHPVHRLTAAAASTGPARRAG